MRACFGEIRAYIFMENSNMERVNIKDIDNRNKNNDIENEGGCYVRI